MKNLIKLGGALPLLCAAGWASATPNLVVNPDFASGNTGFSTGYTLTTMTPDLFQNGVHGIYTVEAVSSIPGSSAYGDWTNLTTDPTGGNGNVFVADGATVPDTAVWAESIPVTPNTQYLFTFFGGEVSNPCCSNADLLPSIDGTDGTALATTGAWQQSAGFTWNSGANTTADISVTDTNIGGPYNDFAVDDFSFTQVSTAPSVPEPAPLGLAVIALAGLALGRARRRPQALNTL